MRMKLPAATTRSPPCRPRRIDLPVVDGLEVHGRVALALNGVLIDFAESRGHGAEHGVEPLGQAAANFEQPFIHELAGEPCVDAVLKDQRDHGEAELGDGANALGAGDAHERALDGESHELLHFAGRHGGAFGDDGSILQAQTSGPLREVQEGLDGDSPLDLCAAEGLEPVQVQVPVQARAGPDAGWILHENLAPLHRIDHRARHLGAIHEGEAIAGMQFHEQLQHHPIDLIAAGSHRGKPHGVSCLGVVDRRSGSIGLRRCALRDRDRAVCRFRCYDLARVFHEYRADDNTGSGLDAC